MSIATQIARLTGLRNRLRDKINALGIDNNNQLDLGDCVTAVESIGGTQDITGTSTVDVAAKQYARVNDANLIPGNIVSGVSILGVTGTASVSPSAASLTTASVPYGGQNVPSTLYPPTGYDGFDRVLVELTDANRTLTAGNIKNGVTIMGVTGSYETPTETQSPSLSDLVTDGITSHSVTITPSSGKHLSQVTIPQITSEIDDNITNGNIKNGVRIMGVTGSYETPTETQSPSLSSLVTDGITSHSVTITPSSGKHLSQVTIPRITSAIDGNIAAGNIKNGVTILGVTGTYSSTYSYFLLSNGVTNNSFGRYTTITFSNTTFPGTLPQFIAIYATTSNSMSTGKIINLHKCPHNNNQYVVNYMNTNGVIDGTVLDASTMAIELFSGGFSITIYHATASFADQNYEGIAIF